MTITYTDTLDRVDWAALKADLVADDFDNHRTPDQYERSFRNSYAVILAMDGERVVGTVRMLSDGVCNAYVVDVWTKREYRRQGIARAMMERLLAKVPGQHVSLWTDSATGFYEKLGFRVVHDTLLEKVVGVWLQND